MRVSNSFSGIAPLMQLRCLRLLASFGSLATLIIFQGCGGGGTNLIVAETPTELVATPDAPKLVQAVSVIEGKSILTWDIAQSDVAYEVHASLSENFEPSSNTKVGEIVGKNEFEALIPLTNTKYYIRLVAKRRGAAVVNSLNSLPVTAVNSTLKVRTSTRITRAETVGLLLTSIESSEALFLIAPTGILPMQGEYLYALASSTSPQEYLIKVQSAAREGTTVKVIYSMPVFEELFESGYLSISTRSSTADFVEATASTDRKQALGETKSPAAAAKCEPGIRLDVANARFAPDAGIDMGFDARGEGFVKAWATGSATADLEFGTSDVASVSYSCIKDLLKPNASFIRLPFVFPIWVGMQTMLKLGLEGRASEPLSALFRGSLNGAVGTTLKITALRLPQIDWEGSRFEARLGTPSLDSKPKGAGKYTLTADASFGVDGLVSFFPNAEWLTLTVAKAYLAAGLKGVIEHEETKGFIKREGIQKIQLKEAKLQAFAAVKLFLGLEGKLMDTLKLNAGINSDFQLTGPIDLFATPVFDMNSNERSVGKHISEGTLWSKSEGGRFAEIESKSEKWFFAKTNIPDILSPLPPTTTDGASEIKYTVQSQSCATFSAIDNIFGERGRRFAVPKNIGSAEQIILYFSPSSASRKNKFLVT